MGGAVVLFCVVIHCGIVQHRSIREQFLLKLTASLGGSYARFEAMSTVNPFMLASLYYSTINSLTSLYFSDDDERERVAACAIRHNRARNLRTGVSFSRIRQLF